MVTGNWTPDKKTTGASRKHASMRLNCYNHFGDISHTRRCNASNKAQRKSNASRQIDDAQYGRRDPSDTPEGQMCGIVHVFCCGTSITAGSSNRVLMKIMHYLSKGKKTLEPIWKTMFKPVSEMTDDEIPQTISTNVNNATAVPAVVLESSSTKAGKSKRKFVLNTSLLPNKRAKSNSTTSVVVNDHKEEMENDVLIRVDGGGFWSTKKAESVLKMLRGLRQRCEIDPFTSMEWEDRFLNVRCMAARNVRPLIHLKNLLKIIKNPRHPLHDKEYWDFQELMDHGVIEFFDALEEPSKVIAFSIIDFINRSKVGERFTHMEVDQSWMLGIISASFPFADHNQGPRAVLAASMLKQAFVNMTNPLRHCLAKQTMYNTQRSPCYTRAVKDHFLHELSAGPVVKLVIYSHRANQEDAWLGNRTAKQLGLWFSTKHRTYVTGTRKPTNGAAMPKNNGVNTNLQNITLLSNNYDKVGTKTLPDPGTYLVSNHIHLKKKLE